MTNLAALYAGSRILAAAARGIAPLAAYKASDETVSTLTLQNDDALLLPVAANATYMWVMFATYTGGTAGSSDLKSAWTYPSGATMLYGRLGVPASGGLAFAKGIQSDVVNYQTSGSGTNAFFNIGTLVVSSTPGTLQWQWCTNTTPAVNTTVHAGSVLAAWQIA